VNDPAARKTAAKSGLAKAKKNIYKSLTKKYLSKISYSEYVLTFVC